jgi:nitrite reductase (NADH) small subunit
MGKAFELNGEKIALFKTEDGNIFAIENRCPHLGGELSQGILSGKNIFCPLHDLKICTKTGKSEESHCIKTYEIKIADNHVYLYKGEI